MQTACLGQVKVNFHLTSIYDHSVFEAFSKAGKVDDVRLIVDERSGKCQGVGYVEMADIQGAANALLLNGTIISRRPC